MITSTIISEIILGSSIIIMVVFIPKLYELVSLTKYK